VDFIIQPRRGVGGVVLTQNQRRGIAGCARDCKSRRKSEVVKLADPQGARSGEYGVLIDGLPAMQG